MADKRPTKAGRPAKGDRPGFTTCRLLADDAEVLNDLAAKRNTTVADIYRDLFSAKAKDLLIEETRRRLKELEGK